MSNQDMALVAPLPVPHDHESTFSRFNQAVRRSSDITSDITLHSPSQPSHLNHHQPSHPPAITLESLASLLSTSPTGGFSYLGGSLYDDQCFDSKVRRCPMQKSRSFPNAKLDASTKSCVLSRSPLRKVKSVRFADSQGLPLVETVHHLQVSDSSYTECKIVPYSDDDIFRKVPVLAGTCANVGTTRFNNESVHTEAPPSSSAVDCTSSNLTQKFKRPISPNFIVHKHEFGFTQPSLEPDFFQRVAHDCVVLESVREEPRSLHGIVRVKNLAYEKEVCIRWTHDSWRTSHDTRAVFCSNDGTTDRFAFELPINGDDVNFAIRYRTQAHEFWDNNRGNNYTVFSRD